MIKIIKISSANIDEFMKLGLNTNKKDLLKLIQSPNYILFIAKEGKEITGFSIISYDPDSRDGGNIYAFAVKEGKIGQDIVEKLIAQTRTQIKALDSNNMFRRTQVSNETVKSFFKRYGLQISELLNPLLK